MKRLILLSIIFLAVASCGKKKDSELEFTIAPTVITLLNANTASCVDRATSGSTSKSALASAAMFQTMSWSWKNTERDLIIYAIRFSSSDANFPSKIDNVVSGNDLLAFEGLDPSLNATCTTCYLNRIAAGGLASKFSFSTGTLIVDQNNTPTTLTACAPIVGGFAPATANANNNFTAQVKVTLMAYSKDDAGNIQNEYAQVPVTVRYEATPP